MKTKKQPIAIFAALFLLGIAFAHSCSSGRAPDDENGAAENGDRAVGAPADLSYEYGRSNEVKLLWSVAANANFYQLTVEDKPYSTLGTYYTLSDTLLYKPGCTYTWKVRAGRKLTTDTVYSAWETSTFTAPTSAVAPIVSPPIKFKGIWRTDSADVSAAMGRNPLPVDSLIPNNLNVGFLNLEIAEDDGGDENKVFLSVVGLTDFLPIEDQSLNRITMTPDSKTGGIRGEVAIDPKNNVRTQDFDPPILLSDLGIDLPSDLIPGLPLDNIGISSFTLTFNQVAVAGKLKNEEATKAQYEITVNTTISVQTTAEEIANLLLNIYLESNPISITVTAHCTKVQGSN